MAAYKITYNNEKRKKIKAYTYDDFTNVQLVVSLVALAVEAFIYVTKFFFSNITEINLLRYIAYACLPVLAIGYINKIIEKKGFEAKYYEEEEKNRFAKLLLSLNIISFLYLVELDVFGLVFKVVRLVILFITVWELMIKPVIEKYTTSKDEYKQISFLFFNSIVIWTAIQLLKMLQWWGTRRW